MNGNNPWSALQRFIRPQNQAGEVEICEFCSQPLFPQHRHLLEVSNRRIICACDACALRFQDVTGGRFQLIPREAIALPDFKMEDVQWEDLALPINLVFIFAKGDSGKVAAAYPGAAGATESLLTIETWQTLAAQNPELARMKPDVEALLINRLGDTREYFIAPIDLCFELTGLIRKYWRGLSGGDQVWAEIERFFSRLRQETGLEPLKPRATQEVYA